MIRFFADVRLSEVEFLGGKAASLLKLVDAGFSVPNGFVVFEKPGEKKVSDGEILEYFKKLHAPYVAVRSSANVEDGTVDSFAGQFDTFLFVNEKNLLEKVKECFASRRSERIQQYCASKKIDPRKIKISVVVQEMVAAEVAGVCFTKHPVTNDESVIIVEAAYGLGESVVSGRVTPDLYIVDKKSFRCVETVVNLQETKMFLNLVAAGTILEPVSPFLQSRQKLDENTLFEIAKNAVQIEKMYGRNMDIEWAYAEKQLFLLQARPMTT